MSTLSLSCTPAQRSPQPLVAQHHHHSCVTVLSGSWPAVFLRLTNKSEVCPQLRMAGQGHLCEDSLLWMSQAVAGGLIPMGLSVCIGILEASLGFCFQDNEANGQSNPNED